MQKVACKVILSTRYTSYEQALHLLDIELLSDRRQNLCLKFAKNCLKFDQTKDMFPLNRSTDLRHSELYRVQHANRARLENSALPQLQRMLNEDAKQHK